MQKMSSDDYVTIRQIGKGAYGTAHIVQHKVTGERSVLKRVRLARQNAKERQCSVRELLLLSNLRHRNVLEYKGCWIEGGCNLCMLVELCESGDLFTQLRLRHPSGIHFSEEHLHEMAVQLLSAVAYLHRSNIAHRDLKTANILITGDGCLKLADFGLSCVLEPESGHLTEAMVGTPNYMSPCVLTKKPYGTPNDVWGLGCVLFELSALKPAYQAFNMAGLIKKVTTGPAPAVPSCYSEHWRQLVRSMLTKEPSLRPSAEELLQLEWLQPAVRRVADRFGPALPTGAPDAIETLSDLPPDIMGLLDTFLAQEREEKRRADEARERRRAAAAKWDPMTRAAAAATAAAAAAAAQQPPSKLPPLKPHVPRKPPPRAFRHGVLAMGAAAAAGAGADAATRVAGVETAAGAGRAVVDSSRPDGASTVRPHDVAGDMAYRHRITYCGEAANSAPRAGFEGSNLSVRARTGGVGTSAQPQRYRVPLPLPASAVARMARTAAATGAAAAGCMLRVRTHRPSSAPPESPARRSRRSDSSGPLIAGDPQALCGHLEVCPDGEEHSATARAQAEASCSKHDQGDEQGTEVLCKSPANDDGEAKRRRGVSSSNVAVATFPDGQTACRRVGSLSGVSTLAIYGGAAAPSASAQRESSGAVASGSAWAPRSPVPLSQAISLPSSPSFQRPQSDGMQDIGRCPLDVVGVSGNLIGCEDDGGRRNCGGAGRAGSRQGWQGQQHAVGGQVTNEHSDSTFRCTTVITALPQRMDSSERSPAGRGIASAQDGSVEDEDGNGEVRQLQSHRTVTVRHSCPAGAFPRRANSEVIFRPNAAAMAATSEPSAEAGVGSLTAEGTLEAELTPDVAVGMRVADGWESHEAGTGTAAAAEAVMAQACTKSDFVGEMVQPRTESIDPSSRSSGAAGAGGHPETRRVSSSRLVAAGGRGATNVTATAPGKDAVGLRGNRATVKASGPSNSRPSSATGHRAMTEHGTVGARGTANSGGSRRPSSARRDSCTDSGAGASAAAGGKTLSGVAATTYDRGGKRSLSGRACPASAHAQQEQPQPQSSTSRPVGARPAKAVPLSREPTAVPAGSSRPGSVRPSEQRIR